MLSYISSSQILNLEKGQRSITKEQLLDWEWFKTKSAIPWSFIWQQDMKDLLTSLYYTVDFNSTPPEVREA